MSQNITHADLDAWGDRQNAAIEKLFKAHLSALPCAAHDERIKGLHTKADNAENEAREAFTKASNADAKAEFAKAAATGHLWSLAKIGMASFATAAGAKAGMASAWFHRISDLLQHHKP